MSGKAVIGELLLADDTLLAMLPPDSIKPGVLPLGVTLPAIGVSTVSGVDRNILKAGASKHRRNRVQVTVMAGSDEQKDEILRQVRRACADKVGDFAGVTAVSVLTDVEGPDFRDEKAGIYLQSQDFTVSYNQG